MEEIQNDIFKESNKIKDKFLFYHCMNKSLSVKKEIVIDFEKKINIIKKKLKLIII